MANTYSLPCHYSVFHFHINPMKIIFGDLYKMFQAVGKLFQTNTQNTLAYNSYRCKVIVYEFSGA